MTTQKEYSTGQQKIALEELKKQQKTLHEIMRESVFFDKLFFDLYAIKNNKGCMFMWDACSCIPRKHYATRKKYVEYARDEGWVGFKEDTFDGRRITVNPTPKLVKYVERRIAQECLRIDALISLFTSVK